MGAATSTENAQQSESAPSYWSIMRQGYDELVNAIIRPPLGRLPPREARADGVRVLRTKLQEGGSGIEERARSGAAVPRTGRPNLKGEPCVVFLHGNSSARLEGLNPTSVCLGFGSSRLRLRLRRIRSIGRRLRVIRLLGEGRPQNCGRPSEEEWCEEDRRVG